MSRFRPPAGTPRLEVVAGRDLKDGFPQLDPVATAHMRAIVTEGEVGPEEAELLLCICDRLVALQAEQGVAAARAAAAEVRAIWTAVEAAGDAAG